MIRNILMTIIFVISFKFRALLLCSIFSMDSCMMFVFFLIYLKIFVNRHVSDGCALKTAAFFFKKYNSKMKNHFFFVYYEFRTFSCVAYYPAVQFIFPKYFCYYIIQKKKVEKQWTKKK